MIALKVIVHQGGGRSSPVVEEVMLAAEDMRGLKGYLAQWVDTELRPLIDVDKDDLDAVIIAGNAREALKMLRALRSKCLHKGEEAGPVNIEVDWRDKPTLPLGSPWTMAGGTLIALCNAAKLKKRKAEVSKVLTEPATVNLTIYLTAPPFLDLI
jgi:hypothetical protein